MASSLITSWQKEGGKVEAVTDFIFLGSKDGDCRLEIKRCLLLGRKAMTNLDIVLKSRDMTLPTKVRIVELWFFQFSCMQVRVGLEKELSTEELMLLDYRAGEDPGKSLGLQGDQISQYKRKSTLNIHWKD